MDGTDSTLSFNYEGVKGKLDSLEAQYEAFYTAIQNMDMQVAQTIQVADDSALFGAVAGKLLENWTTYCNPYKTYYNTFRKWSGVVLAAAQSYADWEAKHNGTGEAKSIGDITRNIDPSKDMSFEDARKLAALASGATTLDGNPILDPRGKGKVTINGETYTVATDKDGNVTKITDSKGGEVYVQKDPIDKEIIAKHDTLSPDDWKRYKEGLDPNQRAIANAVESGVAVVSSDQVKQDMAARQTENPYAIVPESLDASTATNDELRAAGTKNYEKAQQVEQQLAEDRARVDNAYVYYANAVRPGLEEAAANGDEAAKTKLEYWDKTLGGTLGAYEDATYQMSKDNTNSIVDGDIVDISTWQSRDGWDGAYQRQQEAIASMNERTSQLNADEVLNEFYDAFLN